VVLTGEGGFAKVQNEVGLTALGRLQVGGAVRPWARVAYDAPHVNLMAYYSGRSSRDQRFLASGSTVEETSALYHLEGQYNDVLWGGRARSIIGGSVRTAQVDSRGTLLPPESDKRADWFGAAFGQLEVSLNAQLRLVGTARVDASNLYARQFSPRAAVVWTPRLNHAVRLSVGRAFQTPNILEYFVSVPAAPPADFAPLEAGLRASPLGPALAGVPNGTLFTNSSAVPVLALGNADLGVERITSYELGYKADLTSRAFASLDFYYNLLDSFVSDLLPGANPAYGPWTAPAAVPASVRDVVAGAVRAALTQAGQPLAAAGLTRLKDGGTAIVVSIGNAGRAKAYGVEVAGGLELTDYLRLDGNYSFSESDIDPATLVLGDIVLANTPQHKGNLSAVLATKRGLSARATLGVVGAYRWASGIFLGDVPASQTVDVSVGYKLNERVLLHGIATNLLDQRRYHLFGGSVIGRQALAGVTLTY